MGSAELDLKSLNSLGEIDRLIHEPARLMIIAYLYVVESADFLFIMRQTGLTKGNLSSHLSKLEAAEYIEIKKEFVHKIPRTFLSLSKKGRKAFEGYQTKMKQFFKDLPCD
ncbi:transcriptional regulator [bacterium]|nr:transcriptional regulator [bacterium]RQV94100.1 MAG: transcriptional regulator [bacterium]